MLDRRQTIQGEDENAEPEEDRQREADRARELVDDAALILKVTKVLMGRRVVLPRSS